MSVYLYHEKHSYPLDCFVLNLIFFLLLRSLCLFIFDRRFLIVLVSHTPDMPDMSTPSAAEVAEVVCWKLRNKLFAIRVATDWKDGTSRHTLVGIVPAVECLTLPVAWRCCGTCSRRAEASPQRGWPLEDGHDTRSPCPTILLPVRNILRIYMF